MVGIQQQFLLDLRRNYPGSADEDTSGLQLSRVAQTVAVVLFAQEEVLNLASMI
jgi:hypothetical protein